ncbi:hypothetical protein KUTeg_024912 [Tegillarca granosa]|uniref:MD-2-related lipid-recognition domain-containing protein n=1 Tax=Tegillarca granosa TaxID=220873 RepID=A0ABQ9E1U0_TEGGR|nr:hypothetical protein KUTeg_024912 [Tegillarca granosa]
MYQQFCLISVAILLTICSADIFKNVLEFEKSPEKEEKSNYRPQFTSSLLATCLGTLPFRNLKDFEFKDCGGKYATVTSLTLKPDGLVFPGQITVGAKGVIHKDIDMPLKASLDIRKKVEGNWFKIPCINNVGSCTYPNVCQQLQPVTCPDVLTQHGIPCHCPFKALFNFDISTISVARYNLYL